MIESLSVHQKFEIHLLVPESPKMAFKDLLAVAGEPFEEHFCYRGSTNWGNPFSPNGSNGLHVKIRVMNRKI